MKSSYEIFEIFIWNIYKAKRESRTFISQFNNVEGLAKGAPIFSNGIEVGKVIKILLMDYILYKNYK